MAKVTMPQLGESVAEGTIGKWLKQPGDTVEKYEPLLEVITDKVNAEVPSPFAGVLKAILVQEGETVPNNAEIAEIETAEDAAASGPSDVKPATAAAAAPDDKGAPSAAATAPTPTAAGSDSPAPAASDASAPTAAAGAPTFTPADGPAGSDERPDRAAASAAPAPTAVAADRAPAPTAVAADAADAPGNPDARMTPAVRRLLREHGLTAAQIVGTGGGGRITREDVTNYVEAQRTGQPVGGQSVGGVAAAPQPPRPSRQAATARERPRPHRLRQHRRPRQPRRRPHRLRRRPPGRPLRARQSRPLPASSSRPAPTRSSSR